MRTPPGNIPSIIRNGSMKPNLHKLALSISRLALQNTIDLHVDWVPRSLNIAMTGGFPYIFSLTWMVSGAPILSIGLQIPTTLSLLGSIALLEPWLRRSRYLLLRLGWGQLSASTPSVPDSSGC